MQGERAQTQGSRLREERGFCSVELPKLGRFSLTPGELDSDSLFESSTL